MPRGKKEGYHREFNHWIDSEGCEQNSWKYVKNKKDTLNVK